MTDTTALQSLADKVDAGAKRCEDCDSDCWEVPDRLNCWIGGSSRCGNFHTDIASGYCPWLMEGLPFPPDLRALIAKEGGRDGQA